MKERSLVAFTILSQMAVGAFWTLGGAYFLVAREAGLNTAGAPPERPFLTVAVLMVLALGASVLHLGTPLAAWRALGNAGSSWLSREVWSTALFTGASALFAGLLWFDRGTPVVRGVVFGVATLLGLALILSMSWAYRLRTLPAWNSWVTPASFLTTALLLGGLAAGVLGAAFAEPWPGRPVGPELPGGAIALLAVEFLLLPLWLAGLAGGSAAARRALARLVEERSAAFKWRLVLMIATVGAAGLAFTPLSRVGPLLLLPAFLLVLVSEVLGRALFYEARVREGV
jgi:anaerobic dimethyl sulfoxide reductase subunit C (anchor subunit)